MKWPRPSRKAGWILSEIMMYYVYILKSQKDNKLYIGYTSNLKLRFQEHINGEVESTCYRRPLELIYYEAYRERESAEVREGQLKKFGSSYQGLIKRLRIK